MSKPQRNISVPSRDANANVNKGASKTAEEIPFECQFTKTETHWVWSVPSETTISDSEREMLSQVDSYTLAKDLFKETAELADLSCHTKEIFLRFMLGLRAIIRAEAALRAGSAGSQMS